LSSVVRIKVLYFGQAREAAGGGEEVLSLPGHASISALLDETSRRHGRLERLRGAMQVALNEEIAEGDEELKDGDVVAFLPPVAGG
jgi:molybdopterin converting factor subunit 1